MQEVWSINTKATSVCRKLPSLAHCTIMHSNTASDETLEHCTGSRRIRLALHDNSSAPGLNLSLKSKQPVGELATERVGRLAGPRTSRGDVHERLQNIFILYFTTNLALWATVFATWRVSMVS